MLGRDLKSTIIIDNSAVSYQFQPENAIPCSNFIDDPNDTDLFELVPLLEAYNPRDRESINAVFLGGASMPARVRVFVDYLVEALARDRNGAATSAP